MEAFSVKQTLITVLVFVGVIILVVVGIRISKEKTPVAVVVPTVTVSPIKEEKQPQRTIGESVEGRPIEVYSFGTGAKHLLFVGGVHGGYEWNSVLLAYTFIDYLKANPSSVHNTLTIDVIPDANPDGVYKVTHKVGRFLLQDVTTDKVILASGRFNAHDVDLNRNFDCKWKPKSTWQSKIVSAGTEAFSEPESKALRNFILDTPPVVAVFWHSKSNGVYASQCGNGILPETLTALDVYSQSSKYPAYKTFDAYEITGAVDDWLSTINIPAITVELETHEAIEWEKNLTGIQALVQHYGK